MRLHRLRLTDVKGVSHRELTFPERGVVVLQGPNEVGKSTLLEAFDRLLDPRCKATSKSARVKELQPVGRDVGPEVEAEFTVGRYRVRFAKRWLRNPTTTLEILAPVHEQLSGPAAQERMDAILAEALDRTLWDALRFAQAGDAMQPGLTDSAVLTRALDGASGAQRHTDGGEALLELVEREYLRYFTPTGRPTGELRRAMDAFNAAQAEAVHAHRAVEETEQLLARHQRLEQEAAELAEVRPELDERLARAEEEAAEVEELTRARDAALLRLEQAQERSARAVADLRDRERTVRALAVAEEAVADARQAVTDAEETVHRLEAAREQAAGEAAAARDAADSAGEVRERAQSDLELLRDEADLEDLQRRVDELERLAEEARGLEDRLSGLTVTTELVGCIEAAEHEVRVRRAQLEQAAAVVRLEALTDGQRVAVGGTETVLAEGEVASHALNGELVVELPGRLRVTVQPAAEDRARAEDLARAEADLARALATAGVEDLATARARCQERSEAHARARRLRERIGDLTAGENLDALVDRLGELQRSVTEGRARRPQDVPLPETVAQARAIARAAQGAAGEAEAAARRAAARLQQVERELAAAQEAVGRSRARLEALQEQVARSGEDLEQARREVSDEELEAAVAERAAEYARVEAVAAEARRALAAADPERVRGRLETARARVAAHEERERAVREQLVAVRAQVELTSGEGRQEVYERALVTLRQLKDELETIDRRARAARQLHDTLQRHRQEAHDAYVRPYTDALERLGRAVYGPTFGVQVDRDLTITARRLDGTVVPFDQLSGGAKEQLGILARLAVASLVDAEEGVPVIIDDALGYTDPERLARVGSVFAGPAEQAQVILLTCTPDRYAHIPGAETIDLTA